MYRTPRQIYECLDKQVIGQDHAKMAASVIVYNTMRGIRSTNLFIGKTGSGKTELFRTLQSLYPDNVFIADASALSAEGWNTSGNHISDVLRNNQITGKRPALIVLDEFDKTLKPACGTSNTDYHAMVQDNLLRLADGDLVEYGQAESANYVCCNAANVSLVFTGAFSEIYETKSDNKTLGFCTRQAASDTEPFHPAIKDLIKYGLKSELAGRIQRIIYLDDPTLESMIDIAYKILYDIQKNYRCKLRIPNERVTQIAQEALDSGLGARRIKALLTQALDDAMFMNPHQKLYEIA